MFRKDLRVAAINILKLHHEFVLIYPCEAITIPQYAHFKKMQHSCDSVTAGLNGRATSLTIDQSRGGVVPRCMNEKMAELPSLLRFDL